MRSAGVTEVRGGVGSLCITGSGESLNEGFGGHLARAGEVTEQGQVIHLSRSVDDIERGHVFIIVAERWHVRSPIKAT